MIDVIVFTMFVLFAVFAVCAMIVSYRVGYDCGKNTDSKKPLLPLFEFKSKSERKLSEYEQKQKAEAEFVDGYEG